MGVVEAGGADLIHVDVMDGHFVPNLTIGPLVVEALHRVAQVPLDVHLMIRDPDRYLDAFADAGAAMISVHVETVPHLHRTIAYIKDRGVQQAPCSIQRHPFRHSEKLRVTSTSRW